MSDESSGTSERNSFLWAAFYSAALMHPSGRTVKAAAELADKSLAQWLTRFHDPEGPDEPERP